jgi:hypothetical protein
MPELINNSANLWVAVEGDVLGADASKDASSSGARSSQPHLMVGTYNAVLPTIPNSTAGALQLDANGRILVGVDYGSGAAGSLTLRSVLATRHEAAATPLSVRLSTGSSFDPTITVNGTVNLGTIGAAATSANQDALIALLPSSIGAKLEANSLSIAPATDATFDVIATQNGAWTFGAPANAPAFFRLSNGTTAVDTIPVSFGALPAGANNIGDVDVLTLPIAFNAGAASATTVRTVLADQHSAATTPLSIRISDGANFLAGFPVTTAEPGVFSGVLTLDTAAYALGDTLGDILAITNAVPSSAGKSILSSITIIDTDNQRGAFDIAIYDRTVTVGTKNAAYGVSDADAAFCIGVVSVTQADYKNMGGHSIATIQTNLGIRANSGTSVFFGTISRDTKTHTANGLRIVATTVF